MLKSKHIIVHSVAIAAFASTMAKIVGFARESVLAALYGAGTVTDAFILAFTIPETLLYFISVSVAASFIPTYHRVKEKTRFTRNVMTCLLLIGFLFSIIFTIFPDALVTLFASHISKPTFDLTVYFVRGMIWAAPFILLIELYSALLEIGGDFFSSGARTIWRNVIVILGIISGVILSSHLFVSLSVVIGNIACLFSLALASRKRGYVYHPYLDVSSDELKKMLLVIAPMFLSTAASEISAIVNRNFAASLMTGAISSLNYSNKTAGLFMVIFGQSLITVLFPRMSELAADNNIVQLKDNLIRAIMYIIILLLPICIGVAILAQPIIRILFQRGSFTLEDTLRTASCLKVYAIMIFSGSLNTLFIRVFYALRNTKTPASISITAILTNVILNILLIEPLGVQGLALASSACSLLSTLLLFIFLRRSPVRPRLKKNMPEFIKISIAVAAMGIGACRASLFLPFMTVPVWQCVLFCSVLAIAAALFYGTLLLALRSKTAFDMIIMLMQTFYKWRKTPYA